MVPTAQTILELLGFARDVGVSWADVDWDAWDTEGEGSLPRKAPSRSLTHALEIISEYGDLERVAGTSIYQEPPIVRDFAAWLCLRARDEHWRELVAQPSSGGKRRHARVRTARRPGHSSTVSRLRAKRIARLGRGL